MNSSNADPTCIVTEPIPTWPPNLPGIEAALIAAFQSGEWGKYHGEPLQSFRSEFGKWLGKDFVWTSASGTIAVELALRGCGVRAGDLVIMAGYDFPGNFRAVEAIGARPLLIDVSEGSYVADLNQLAEAIEQPNVKAVLLSHLHGQLQDMKTAVEICQRVGVALVEDACQVPGAKTNERLAGTIGNLGVFSFGGSKLLTAGRGGAVVCEDEATMQRIRIAAERGNDAYPLSALQASVLIPQLDSLLEFHERRLAAANQLDALVGDSSTFQPVAASKISQQSPAYYKYPLRVRITQNRDLIMGQLKQMGLPADIGFRGFVKRSQRRCNRLNELPNSKIAAEGTILIHHPVLLGESPLLEQVAMAIRKVDPEAG